MAPAPSPAPPIPDTRLTHVHRADPGLYQPFRQVAIAYNPATAPVINQRRMTFEKLGNFSFHGLSQQLTAPQLVGLPSTGHPEN